MSSWHSYPKIYNFGHAALEKLLSGPVFVQEKIDGSQFSFGVFNGELRVRSKGAVMQPDAPEKMFLKAVEAVRARRHLLMDGWTYRAEYLAKPKHNTLAYDRTPKDHLILFDVNTDEEKYVWGPVALAGIASAIEFESVPFYEVDLTGSDALEKFHELLNRTSCLGGQKIEGVVVKNYAEFGPDKKVLMGKHVSEAFKEIHKADWRERNPTKQDLFAGLVAKYRSPARWNKALQHLKERGEIENSPRDIGKLIKEAQRDLISECADEIKADLFAYVLPKIMRGTVGGLPEWYKEELLKSQFEQEKS